MISTVHYRKIQRKQEQEQKKTRFTQNHHSCEFGSHEKNPKELSRINSICWSELKSLCFHEFDERESVFETETLAFHSIFNILNNWTVPASWYIVNVTHFDYSCIWDFIFRIKYVPLDFSTAISGYKYVCLIFRSSNVLTWPHQRKPSKNK